MKNRILRIAAASILGLSVFIATLTTYRHFSRSEPKYTLREALWVSDREMKHFYPPFSPQSQAIVEVFQQSAIKTDEKAYNEHVLYRLGLTRMALT